jgi:hypothetical protein
VKPTDDHFEHLVIEGDTVNILEMDYHTFERLQMIKSNRAAKYVVLSQTTVDRLMFKSLPRVLEIASLGDEILASLHVLYAKDKFFDKAEALRIFSFMGKYQICRALVIGYLHQSASTTQPKVWHQIFSKIKSSFRTHLQVLADRTRALQRLVDDRRSWWRSLIRDLKKQFNAQPLFFYGALLAIFFGVCTVIQTVASVWSLALALKAAK